MILGKPLLESSDVPRKQHHGRRADGGQPVCARIQEWIGCHAGLRAFRAEVVCMHGWTGHRALPIRGEPNMQDGADVNHRFLALACVTQHTLPYLAEQLIIQVWISTHFGVLSEQFPVADENLFFITPNFTPAPVPL